MIIGLIFGTLACLLWGLVFFIPEQMIGFNSIEVALGRYLFYGLVSTSFILCKRCTLFKRYPLKIWFAALIFALVGNIFYYTALVFGVKYANASITALILGISPISIALYGNFKQKTFSFRSLALPCVLIAIGLALVNLEAFEPTSHISSMSEYILGLSFAFAALLIWTLFAVSNAKILNKNPSLASGDWVTMLGFTTLIWVILIGSGLSLLPNSPLDFTKYSTADPAFQRFLFGNAVLGIFCSWLGSYLWNRASTLLPVSILGQLIIFETIFGLVFVHLFKNEWPPGLSFLGMSMMLFGIVMSLNVFRKQTSLIES